MIIKFQKMSLFKVIVMNQICTFGWSKVMASLILIFTLTNSQASTVFNVKDFNAKGDGKSDDILAFERCALAAIKTKDAEILIPFGIYKISRPWMLSFIDETIIITGLENSHHLKPTIFINKVDDVMRIGGFLFNQSKGIIKVSNLTLAGSNPPYSATHLNINKNKWFCGLAVTDKKEAYIDNVDIRDIYGEGIYISDTKQVAIPKTARFDYIEIKNCAITNVWGYNPQKDDYGDGIYIANVAKGLLQNNLIYNNTKVTKQIGRAGIVLEYMSENIHIINNVVKNGYDRAIHVESTFGGHLIEKNKFLGSDLSFVLVEQEITESFKLVMIRDNLFSNVNFIKGSAYNKTYASNSYGDRALLYTITKGMAGNNKIKFLNNTFFVNGDYVYNSNSILNNRSSVTYFYHNTYSLINVLKGAINVFNYGRVQMDSEHLTKGIEIKY